MSKHFKIAVIGTGPGGYIAALKAAQMGAKTAVVEKHLLGGTCLNYGCIPSKALLASAELLHKTKNSKQLGIKVDGEVNFDWPAIQNRKDLILKKLRGGIKGLFTSRQVELFNGKAIIQAPGKIQITDEKGNSEIITAEKVILAPGSVPARIGGWPDEPEYICTSDEALHWKELPKRFLIVGGGVIGCEFACMMNEYGVKVTIVEMMEQLLPEMDLSLGQSLSDVFSKRGVDIHTGVKVEEISIKNGNVKAIISGGKNLEIDKVLVATGRRPNTQELGLESIGLDTNRGFIKVNDKMETAVKNYYCIGDANGRCLLAHAASAQGMVAVKNALGDNAEQSLPVPNGVYTFPEIASVGITTQQAQKQKIPVSIGRFPTGYLGKAMAVAEEFGFVKVIRHRENNTLLGVHIIGHNATEIIESATAMLSAKADTKDLAEMIFAHPTLSEAVKEAAEDSFGSAMNLPPRKITKITAEAEEMK
ncbi:MAG: dihydrolipoyl dehydrogenase [Sedimentisphaerales bacterium]|nr:dihydrolipoyl dehydrogenase [Sedimentisphaerales bacterium]